MQELTKSEFLEKIENSSVYAPIDRCLIIESVSIHELPQHSIQINNCEFAINLFIKGTDLRDGIAFNNCDFRGSFEIIHCHAKTSNRDKKNIKISNSRINQLVLAGNGNSHLHSGILINENTSIEKLDIRDIGITNGGVIIKKSIIKSLCSITDSLIQSNLEFSDNTIIDCPIFLHNNSCNQLQLFNSEFNGNIDIRDSQMRHFRSLNSNFKKSIYFTIISDSKTQNKLEHIVVEHSIFGDKLIFQAEKKKL